jgi:hypothetical protein
MNPVLIDGVVMLHFQAWEAQTGKELWRHPYRSYADCTPCASAWRWEGKAYFLANSLEGEKERTPRGEAPIPRVACIEARTGRITWDPKDWVPNRSTGTPAVVGDIMVAHPGRAYAGWRLRPDKPVLLWKQGGDERDNTMFHQWWQSPAVTNGLVFVFGNDKTAGMYCFDLVTGRKLWEANHWLDKTNIHCGPFHSPAIADGKIFALEPVGPGTQGYSPAQNGKLHVIAAAGEQYRRLYSWAVDTGLFVSPTVANGRLYVKSKGELICYDLRAVP